MTFFAFALFVFASLGSMYYLWGDAYPAINFPVTGIKLSYLATALIFSLSIFFMGPFRRYASNKVGVFMCLATLTGIYFFYYTQLPIWRSGSDSASALVNGFEALLSGSSPYSVTSHLGNPLTPLLGGFIGAAPFILITDSVDTRGLFWVTSALIIVAGKKNWRSAAGMAIFIALSPNFRGSLAAQNDFFVIACEIIVITLLAFDYMNNTRRSPSYVVVNVLMAVCLGIVLADRFIFWPVLLPILVMICLRKGIFIGLIWLVCASGTLLALTLAPFIWGADDYLAGPFAVGLSKASSGVGHSAPLIVASVALLIAITGSIVMRTNAHMFLTMSLTLFSMILVNGLLLAASEGFIRAFAYAGESYETVAYNGSWLFFGLAALFVPKNIYVESLGQRMKFRFHN